MRLRQSSNCDSCIQTACGTVTVRCSYEASCLSGYLKGGLDKLNGVSSEDGPEKGEMQAEDPERLFRLPPGPCISAETLRCLVDELEHTAIRRKAGDGVDHLEAAAGARETRIDLKTLAVADFFALHRAARFFDVAHLELQLVLHLASRLRGKTAQQIRDEFSIAALPSRWISTPATRCGSTLTP